MMFTDQLTPSANETQEDFIIRAHQALMKEIPDPEERNLQIWSAWRAHRGLEPAEERAQQKTDPNRYHFSPNHCHFAEHEIPRVKNGQVVPVRNSLPEIVDVIRQNNKRLSDRGHFTAICDNHTDPEKTDGSGDPPVIGKVGAVRLGMVGYENPQFAIFGDEFHQRESLSTFKSKPRRSVELLHFPTTGERFIDPVAVLGGRAPRLALPSHFSAAEHNGAIVERFSAVAPGPEAFPGGNNTYTPGDNREKKTHEIFNSGEESMLSNEDIAQLIDAMMQTPPMQWAAEQMAAQQGETEAEPALEQNMAVGPVGGAPVMTPPTEETGYNQQKFAAIQSKDEIDVDRFNAVQGELNSVRGQLLEATRLLADQGQQLQTQRYAAADADRSATLAELSRTYPNVFDVEEESKRFLYSAGASVTDQEFQQEIDRMESIGRRIATSASSSIPAGALPREKPSVERNAAFCAQVTELSKKYRETEGITKDWEALCSEVEAQIAAS